MTKNTDNVSNRMVGDIKWKFSIFFMIHIHSVFSAHSVSHSDPSYPRQISPSVWALDLVVRLYLRSRYCSRIELLSHKLLDILLSSTLGLSLTSPMVVASLKAFSVPLKPGL